MQEEVAAFLPAIDRITSTAARVDGLERPGLFAGARWGLITVAALVLPATRRWRWRLLGPARSTSGRQGPGRSPRLNSRTWSFLWLGGNATVAFQIAKQVSDQRVIKADQLATVISRRTAAALTRRPRMHAVRTCREAGGGRYPRCRQYRGRVFKDAVAADRRSHACVIRQL